MMTAIEQIDMTAIDFILLTKKLKNTDFDLTLMGQFVFKLSKVGAIIFMEINTSTSFPQFSCDEDTSQLLKAQFSSNNIMSNMCHICQKHLLAKANESDM